MAEEISKIRREMRKYVCFFMIFLVCIGVGGCNKAITIDLTEENFGKFHVATTGSVESSQNNDETDEDIPSTIDSTKEKQSAADAKINKINKTDKDLLNPPKSVLKIIKKLR